MRDWGHALALDRGRPRELGACYGLAWGAIVRHLGAWLAYARGTSSALGRVPWPCPGDLSQDLGGMSWP